MAIVGRAAKAAAARVAHAPAPPPSRGAPLRLPPLPTIGQVIQLYKLSAKQKLSQNFLLDLNITDRMVRAAGPVTDSTLIEVGSGPGSLTRSCLLAGSKHVLAVEKDPRFVPALKQLQTASDGRLTPALGDALLIDEARLLKHVDAEAVDWAENDPRVKLIGNLPFAISTPLLLKWLRLVDQRRGPFSYGRVPMVLTFQAEVADRLVASPGNKEFGRLSVMTQQLCDVRTAFTILGKSFVPAPEVDARVVFIQPRVEPVAPMLSYRTLEFVLREVMGLRRKQLVNAIERLGDGAEELLSLAELNPKARPEDITVPEWVRLANIYHKWPKKNIPKDFLPKHVVPRNYTSVALKFTPAEEPKKQEQDEDDEEGDGVVQEHAAPIIHFPQPPKPSAEELEKAAAADESQVLVRRVFSPDVLRVPPPMPSVTMPPVPPPKPMSAATKEKLDERIGLKQKEMRKVVKPLQPGNPSKLLPSPAKFRAQLASEVEHSMEEAERRARNSKGNKFRKYSDRFEEEHAMNRRKAKERRNAIAKAKRTRTHKGLMRANAPQLQLK